MSTRRRSARRRNFRNNRKAQIAVTVSVSLVAVAAAVFGITFADQHTSINQAAFGSCLSSGMPQASGTAQAPGTPAVTTSDGASAVPCPVTASASPTVSGVPVTPSDFASGPVATQTLGDIASRPVDGSGNAISFNQGQGQAANSGNCTLVVPWNPLTAAGLATPYQLGDGCSMGNTAQQAYVEATILSPGGQVQVYNPLVVTQGTRPAARPVPPQIARGSQVILDFGFNGTNLVLTGPGAVQRSSGCVDAYGQSVIGQVAACNAVPFYNLANSEIARGTLKVPQAGTAADGQPCETVRDFGLVDQDQSDNVVSQYLLNGNGQTAQATSANKTALAGATTIANGSDDALLSDFVDPANGCTPYTATDPTNPSGTSGSQALNELSARVNQKTNIAVVPTNDEMTLVGGADSVAKTNVYRSLVDQPQLAANTDPTQVAASYCMNMVNIQPAHDQADMAKDTSFTTPVADTGDTLATFLGNRLSMSFSNLGCDTFGLTDPANVTTDGNGVATAVTYTTTQQQATIPAPGAGQGGSGSPTPTPTGSSGGGNPTAPPRQGHGYRDGHHHRFQDPSGM